MGTFVLIADLGCAPCEILSQEVANSLEGIDVVGLSEARSRGLIGEDTPKGPLLLETTNDAVARCWSGWSLRLRLARLLGMRRAVTATRLLHAEFQASMSRSRPLARRTVLTGLAATAIGLGHAKSVSASPRSAALTQQLESSTAFQQMMSILDQNVSQGAHQMVQILDQADVLNFLHRTADQQFELSQDSDGTSVRLAKISAGGENRVNAGTARKFAAELESIDQPPIPNGNRGGIGTRGPITLPKCWKAWVAFFMWVVATDALCGGFSALTAAAFKNLILSAGLSVICKGAANVAGLIINWNAGC